MSQQELTGGIMGLKALRESRREIVGRVRSRVKEQNRIEKQIAEALKDGPKTVPEISQETGPPPETILWVLMALKKYGKVVEGQQKDSYFTYGLKEG
jgi:predicted Rossmann fold nucleotide-binding protein DprA/Smf involved in DNA uptake